MKIALVTTQIFSINTFFKLKKIYIDFVLITIDNKLSKKNNVSGYFDFSQLCQSEHVPLIQLNKYDFSDPKDFNLIKKAKIDVMCVLGWNRIIPQRILDEIRIGTIGSHSSPGLLPFGRGRAPVVWTIKLGFNQIYTHLFKMTYEIDRGDILSIKRIPINKDENISYIYKKISFSQTLIIDEAIKNLVNGKKVDIETDDLDLFFPKRDKSNAEISWNNSADDIHNLIRAVSPSYHGAFCMYNNEKYEVFSSKVWDVDCKGEFQVGEIISVLEKVLLVKCNTGILAIIEHNIPLESIKIGSILN